MILVDTNVWVQSTDPKRASTVGTPLAALVETNCILGHEFVLGELVLGSGGSKRKLIVDRYVDLQAIDMLSTDAVKAFIKAHDLAGKNISWVDAHLLASTHASGAKLWTEDPPLKTIAKSLGIAYEPEEK